MKYLILTVMPLILLACNVNKKILSQESNLIGRIEKNCPENGVCTFEVLNNKILEIKKDDTGAFYPLITDGKKTVLKYEYKKNEIENVADNGYSEIIYIEINTNTESLLLKNNELEKAKVLYGRLCFCRGQSGYFPVKDGELKISKNNETTQLDFNFKVKEVPQLITKISESF